MKDLGIHTRYKYKILTWLVAGTCLLLEASNRENNLTVQPKNFMKFRIIKKYESDRIRCNVKEQRPI